MWKFPTFVLNSLLFITIGWNYLIDLAASGVRQSIDDGKMERRIAKNRTRASEANACMEYSGGFVFAKTQKYHIEICGDKIKPLSYYISTNKVGDSKRTDLVLDLQSYTFDRQVPRKNEKFIAVKGDTQYILTRTSMTVKRKNRIVSTEKVIYYRRLT
jgi:hypothetical protein